MVTCAIFLALVGLFQATMDTLLFHYSVSIFARLNKPLFWDPDLSWKNKYATAEGGEVWINRPRFPGSETILVWLTDAWHLFVLLRNSAIVLAVIFSPGFPVDILHVLIYLAAGKTIIAGSFSFFYWAFKVK